MDINNIQIFIEVTNAGSFARVAQNRNVDPSSISRSITTLEKQLGFKLFKRSTRRITITDAGQIYFDSVVPLINELQSASTLALEEVKKIQGKFRLAACTSFGQKVIAPLLVDLQRELPDLSIELKLSDEQIDLQEEKIDLAIRFGKKPQADLESINIMPRSFMICASPDYLEQHEPIQSPADLSKHNCITFHLPGYRSAWRFRDRNQQEFKVAVSGNIEVSHGMTLTSCASLGLGIAIIPEWLCSSELENGTLIELFKDYECTPRDFGSAMWLVFPKSDFIPKKLKTIIDFFAEKIPKSLQASTNSIIPP